MTKDNKGKGVLINDVDLIRGIDKAYSAAFSSRRKFHKCHAQLMDKLVPLIMYENIIYGKADEVMEMVGISDRRNFFRSLKQVEHLVILETSRTDKSVPIGYIKLFIHPLYGWRECPSNRNREKALEEFRAFFDLAETSKKDITLSPYYTFVMNEIQD